jgi:hypothetical protein
MRTQVVHHEVDTLSARVTSAEPLPRLENVPGGFSFMDDPFKNVSVDIIEGKQLLRAGFLIVGRPYALGMPLSCQAHTRKGA